MNATKTVKETHNELALVAYVTGEVRIENETTGQCTQWLDYDHVDMIMANPEIMAEYDLDCEI